MGLFSRAFDRMVSEKVPHKRRRRMIVFVAILTLLSMVTSTVAWFSVNTFAGVDKIDVHISVAAQLRVSMEDHGSDINAYVKTITNEMVDTYLARQNTRLSEIVLDPVTTANGTTFTNQRGVQREPNKKSYLEFECYFIATEPMWVHLTTESSQTIEGDNGTRVTSTSPAPQNEVVQCTRVGFTTDADGTAVYEPNKGTQINGLNTFDISTPMTYSDSSSLFHLDELTPKKATLRIWVDGEDPQCDDDVQLS